MPRPKRSEFPEKFYPIGTPWLTSRDQIRRYTLDRAPFRSRYVTGRWVGSYYPRNTHGAYVLVLTPKPKYKPKRPKPLPRVLPPFPRLKGMIQPPPDPSILYVYAAARKLWYGNVDLLPPSLSKRGKGTRRRTTPVEPRAVMQPGTGIQPPEIVIELVRTRLRPTEILLDCMPRLPELIGHGRGAPFNSTKHWREESKLKKLIEVARTKKLRIRVKVETYPNGSGHPSSAMEKWWESKKTKPS